MRRWNIIMRVFLCEYLHLVPESKPAASLRERDELVSVIPFSLLLVMGVFVNLTELSLPVELERDGMDTA